MFALEVTEELESWPEQGNRHRRWVSIDFAANELPLVDKIGQMQHSLKKHCIF